MLKELRNYKQKLFLVSATKIGESATNILKLMFFTINLHFFLSNDVHNLQVTQKTNKKVSFMRYLHNNKMMLITKFQSKAD